MIRIEIIHWKPAEIESQVGTLTREGYDITCGVLSGPSGLRRLRESPPDAFIIDLSRLPSHGRDVGLALRQFKATRHVPLIFVGGDPDKVARIHELLPDAIYTAWDGLLSPLKRAIAHPSSAPVVPASIFQAYSGTPLYKKLGIKSGYRVALMEAPKGFKKLLADVPDGVKLCNGLRGHCDLLLFFVHSRRQLEAAVCLVAQRVKDTPVWMAWPKQASGLETDLTQQVVRETGLAAGLVDYKICAIDATWSGLLFRRRKITLWKGIRTAPDGSHEERKP